MKSLREPQRLVRTRHDEWTKRVLSLWLDALGDVELEVRIAGESRRGDVLYTERRKNEAHRRRLGLLGELAHGRVLFEPFRNPFTIRELKSCLLKTVDLAAAEARKARRAKRPQSTAAEPAVCVITPTMSREVAIQAGAKQMPGGVRGVHTLAPMWNAFVVVVHSLPDESATLWLRLLGRGRVQARAVRELEERGGHHLLEDATLRLLVAWLQALPPPEQRTEEERELAMNLDRAYERWERKVKAESKLEGKLEGKAEGAVEARAEAVLTVLESRGLHATSAQRKQVLACKDRAQLDVWLRGAATAPSVKELLAKSATRRTRRV